MISRTFDTALSGPDSGGAIWRDRNGGKIWRGMADRASCWAATA